ncbi:hypothetical protein ACFCYC_32720 [Streptomyces sp. NPDC056402]|uniref:hypothetical protein n=1 Tax=Streptomyces sp. NPDC056402 TaxID=3345810 RepID=UPI0035DEFBC4
MAGPGGDRRPAPGGLLLDGELVVWDTEAERLSFDALQRRAATCPAAQYIAKGQGRQLDDALAIIL